MKRDCSTCAYKEGSCYPSGTIFDKNKTCKSYDPDYEGYIADLEKENLELRAFKEKCKFSVSDICKDIETENQLTKAIKHLKDLVYVVELGKNELATARIVAKAKEFLKEIK